MKKTPLTRALAVILTLCLVFTLFPAYTFAEGGDTKEITEPSSTTAPEPTDAVEQDATPTESPAPESEPEPEPISESTPSSNEEPAKITDFTFSGDYPFVLDDSITRRTAYRSSNRFVNASTSAISATITVPKGETRWLVFDYALSCEFRYDHFSVSVNGTVLPDFGGTESSGETLYPVISSGDSAVLDVEDLVWNQYQIELSGGEHTVEWSFVKNDLAPGGLDGAWLSNVVLYDTKQEISLRTESNDTLSKNTLTVGYDPTQGYVTATSEYGLEGNLVSFQPNLVNSDTDGRTLFTVTATPKPGYKFEGWFSSSNAISPTVDNYVATLSTNTFQFSGQWDLIAVFSQSDDTEMNGLWTGDADAAPRFGNSSGTYHWTHDAAVTGRTAYKSTNEHIDNSSSELFGWFTVTKDCELLFDYFISCESNERNDCDVLLIKVDGREAARFSDYEEGATPGTAQWKPCSIPLTAGAHTVSWSYLKDSGTEYGLDAAWISNLRISEQSPGVTTGGKMEDLFANLGDGITAKVVNDSALPWVYDETYEAFRSGNNGEGTASTLTVTLTASEAAFLSFDYVVAGMVGVSGIGHTDDTCSISINGSPITPVPIWAVGKSESLAAEDWINDTRVPLKAGENTLTFTFNQNTNLGCLEGIWLKNVRLEQITKNQLTANFDNTYGTVTAAVNKISQNMEAGTQTAFISGSEITVTAAAKDGGQFYGWVASDGKTFLTADAGYTFILNQDATVSAVFAAPGTYVARNGGKFYQSLNTALSETQNGDTVILLKDAALTGDTTIPEGVTLLLPYAADKLTVNSASATHPYANSESPKGASDFVKGPEEDLLYTLELQNNASLLISSDAKLVVGGIVGSCSGGNSTGFGGQTVGAHSNIALAESASITIADGGILSCMGYITGGKINVESGGAVYEPFVVCDFRGGTYMAAAGLTNKVTPFERYAMINVQSDLTMTGGAALYGYCNLYASSMHNKTTAKIIATSDAIINLPLGSTLTSSYDGTTFWSGRPEIGRTSIEISGGASTGILSMYILIVTVTTEGVLFPLPYNFDITLRNGNYSLPTMLELLPGSKLTVGENAILEVEKDGVLAVYDGFTSQPYAGPQYPDNEALSKNSLSEMGTLSVDGTLKVLDEGKLGGLVQTNGSGCIELSPNSVAEVEAKAGVIAGQYSPSKNKTTSQTTRTLTAKLYDEKGVAFNMTPGMTYKGSEGQVTLTAGQAGYTYQKWSGESVEAATSESVTVKYTTDQILSGTWTPQYTMTFDSKGGSAVETITKAAGESIELPTPTFEGYNFLGWYTTEDYTGEPYIAAAMPEENITLYAKWDIAQHTVTFQYANEDGTSYTTMETAKVNHSAAAIAPNTDRSGYRFDGWDKEFSNITADTTVTAKYTSYLTLLGSITDFSGENLKTARVYYGLLNKSQKEEYAKTDACKSLFAAIESASSGLLNQAVLAAVGPTNAILKPEDGQIAELSVDGAQNVDVRLINEAYKALGMLDVPFLSKLFEHAEIQSLYFPALEDKTDKDGKDASVYTLNRNKTGVLESDQFNIMFRIAWAALQPDMTYTEFYNYLYQQMRDMTIGALDGKRVSVTLTAKTSEGVSYSVPYTISFFNNTHTVSWMVDDALYVDPTTCAYGSQITVPTTVPTKTGYTFAGWQDASGSAPGAMGKTDLAFTAQWTANTYTVTLDANGGTAQSSIMVTYGGTYAGLPVLTRNGYSFDGWFTTKTGGTEVKTTDTVAITADTTLYAHWTTGGYIISYDLGGGTVSSANPAGYNVETETFTLNNPTKTGYTFQGWSGTGLTGTANQTVTIPKGSTGDRSYTANWKINPYTITFNTDSGTVVESITQDYGTSVTAPGAPTREGYTFAGWEPVVPTAMPAEDTTCTAQWTVNTHKITYMVDGVTHKTIENVDFGRTLTAIAAPTKTGYTFSGWSGLPATMPDEDVTVTGSFTANSYTVSFNANGGTGSMAAQGFTYDAAQALTANAFTRTGYTFAGWNTQADGKGTAYTDKENVRNLTAAANGAITLFAQWKANTYTVSLDAAGGTVTPGSIEVAYDGSYAGLPAPVRTGYDFVGWFVGETQITSETLVSITDAQTLTAHWNAKGDTPYTVNHYLQDLEGDGYKLEATVPLTGQTGAQVQAAQKDYTGFAYNAAASTANGTVAGDGSLVLNLYYDRTTHTVTWKVDGQETTETYRYGVAPGFQGNTEKPDDEHGSYTFTGWDKALATVTGDVTYTAQYHADSQASIGDVPYRTLSIALGKAQSGQTVRLDCDLELTENLTIPAGVTLLLPCMDSDLGYVNRSGILFNPNGTSVAGKPTLHRTLTVPAGVTLTVEGSVLVNAVTGRPAAGHYDQDISGGYAQIDLDGLIIVPSGGTLDVFGLVTGAGQVTAQKGGTVCDLYVVRNWRGGSQALKMYEGGVYPMNEYDCHNIEASLRIESGATYSGLVKMYAGDQYNYTRFPQIDDQNGLIRLTSGDGYVVKTFENGRERYAIHGGADFASSTLTIVGIRLTTAEFLYPIDGDIDFILSGGDYRFVNDYKLLTGVTMEVADDASLTVAEGCTVVFYDAFNDLPNTNNTQYPNRASAVLNLAKGASFTNNGSFAGIIQTAGTKVYAGSGAVWSVSTKEANGYLGAPTTLDLSFKLDIRNPGYSWIWAPDGGIVWSGADYSAVEDALASIPGDLAGYTDATAAAVKAARDAVVYGLPQSSQEQVDAWADALRSAIEKLTPKTLTVTFVPGDGETEVTSITVTYGSPYGTLPVPTRENYRFDGWYTAESGGTRVQDSTTVTMTTNHSLYARWGSIGGGGGGIGGGGGGGGGGAEPPAESTTETKTEGSVTTETTTTVTENKQDGTITTETVEKQTDSASGASAETVTTVTTNEKTGITTTQTVKTETGADGQVSQSKQAEIVDAKSGVTATASNTAQSTNVTVTASLKAQSAAQGTASVQLDDDLAKAIVTNAQSAREAVDAEEAALSARIQVTGTSADIAVEVKLPLPAVTELTKAGAELVLATGAAELVLDGQALAAVEKQGAGEASLIIAPADKASLPEAVRELWEDPTVLEFGLRTAAETDGFHFDGGTVRIAVPYQQKDESKTAAVYYIMRDGSRVRVPGAACEGGKVQFQVRHFSTYVIVEEEPWENTFKDVHKDDWYYNAVEYAVLEGLFAGTAQDAFSPQDSMTRAMLVTVLHRFAGHPGEHTENTFSDVARNEWYTGAVNWAVAQNITTGTDDGRFLPGAGIDRESLVTMLYRYVGSPTGAPAGLNKFADAGQVSGWAADAMAWAVHNGILTGKSGGTLDPQGPATRAEVAVILMRFAAYAGEAQRGGPEA